MAGKAKAPLVVVDATNYLFRSYHAIRDMRTRDGKPTNAIYGLATSLVAMREGRPGTAFACVMDAPGKTFRHEAYPEYKATRKKTDQELIDQIEPAKDLVRALGMPLYCVGGVEADDVIATLARQCIAAGREVLVASSDKDLMYLAGEGCRIINPRDNAEMDAEAVKERYGVPPQRMLDYLTLIGDSVDNVPGVPGVGPKTAAKWIEEYGDLDAIVAHKDELKGKVGERLRESIDQLRESAGLIRLREDVDVDPPAAKVDLPRPDGAAVAGFCGRYRFNPALQERMLRGSESSMESPRVVEEIKVEVLLSAKQVDAARNFLSGNKRLGLHVEVMGADAPTMRIVAVAIAAGDRCFYLPLANFDEDSGPSSVRESLTGLLLDLLGDAGREVCVFGAKPLFHALANADAKIACKIEDVALMAYCLDSTAHGSIEATSRRFLDRPVPERSGIVAKSASLADIAPEDAGKAAGAWAKAAMDLRRTIGRELDSASLGLYRKVELPVVEVLAAMEQAGILLDSEAMGALGKELRTRMEIIEERIASEAGERINLNSPAQLADMLYDRLGFAPGRKTRGGARSTNEVELERLAASGSSEVPGLVLSYRHAAKLVGTYTDALPRVVNPRTGRLHTRFIQAGAVTGRLASVDPNLQNIPARTDDGQRIRRCFVAKEGWKLISADYSQVELRILAHFSKDETLLEAFGKGEDVHRRTASELFGTDADSVDDKQRNFAKTINFGLIYGMGAFGLAQRLDIGQKEARELIDGYFARMPGVRKYLDAVKKQAGADKFVITLHGRKIGVAPRAAGAAAHSGSMRAAINAPMQGTAADIMKLAMPAVHNELAGRGLRSKILLQVHDELVIEAPADEVDILREALPPAMAGVVELDVDLEVEVGVGDNWEEAH